MKRRTRDPTQGPTRKPAVTGKTSPSVDQPPTRGVCSGSEAERTFVTGQEETVSARRPTEDASDKAGCDLEPDPKSRRVDEEKDDPPSSRKHSQSHGDHSPTTHPVTHKPPCPPTDRASAVLRIEHDMSSRLPLATFVSGKVTHVYNPLQHACAPHSDFVRRCLDHGLDVPFLLVGMNPGPWGMSQNGVPFGEVEAVRDWMGVTGEVEPPADEHPQRPVMGLKCTRSEVSGRRFWGLWRRLAGSLPRLSRRAYVHNLCPLAFMERSGRNVTPNCLKKELRERLEPVCRRALVDIIQVLGAHTVVGIGKYAEEQSRRALREAGMEGVRVFPLLHPSPINPQANKDWDSVAVRQLESAGLLPLP